jgi:hypothetical protein
VAASGPLATRLGLPGVPVAAETIALHVIFELMRLTGARVHLCRISSAAGVALVRAARQEGLKVTCDVSINSLHLTDVDIGYFDSRMRLNPPLRQQRDREALRAALADGTIDALVSDHTPVDEDAKTLPFAEAEPGATGLELLLGLALKWSQQDGVDLVRALAVLTSAPARVLGASLGTLQASTGQLLDGAVADLCIFDPQAPWSVEPAALRSQGRNTPFAGHELPASVRCTIVGGQLAYENRPGLSPLRALWRLSRVLLHALRGWFIIVFRFPRWPQQRRDATVQAWSLGMLRILGIGLRVEGSPPVRGPILLVANHLSWLDILVMHAARHCRFVSKADVKHWPLVGTLATGGGTLYIEREKRATRCGWCTTWRRASLRGRSSRCFPRARPATGRSCCPSTPT